MPCDGERSAEARRDAHPSAAISRVGCESKIRVAGLVHVLLHRKGPEPEFCGRCKRRGRIWLDTENRMVEKRAFTPAVILAGVGVGIFQAFSPIVLWWLDAVDIWGVALAMIASVYVGFAVADGRRGVIAAEVTVTFAFVVCATVAMASFPWLIVIGLVGHGLKDLWQHRTQFVANTRWWPPFCLVVDVVAAALTAAILLGALHLRGVT